MNLLNFGDIISLTKQRCNLSDTTDYDDLIKTAINRAYTVEMPKIERTLSKSIMPIINGECILPDDALTIEKFDPELSSDDKIVGYTLFTDRTDVEQFNVWYSPVIDPMIEDEDIPEINKKWFYTLSTYGCYTYYLTKKKMDIASAYLSEFKDSLQNLRAKDNTPKKIKNVYSDMWGV